MDFFINTVNFAKLKTNQTSKSQNSTTHGIFFAVLAE